MMTKAVTIKDIAAQVGVSKMTVSNVLSKNPARHRHVSQETRTRVLEAAQRMQYRPNALARSLRNRRTNVIGLYSGYDYLSPENAFYAAIISGVQRGCDAHRKDLLLHGVFRSHSVQDIHAQLVDGRIDGLILHAPPHDPLIHLLSQSALPVISVADATPGVPSVVVDDVHGSRLLAQYLFEKGHRRVVYHSVRPSLVSVERRRDAFCAAASSLGMAVEDRPLTHVPQSTHAGAGEVAWLGLAAGERATAAACWSDQTALELLEHCRQRGIGVPAELSVVGFDGIMRAPGSGYRLTTVRAPWVEVGQRAVSLLIQSMAGEPIPQETVLPTTLIVGDTA